MDTEELCRLNREFNGEDTANADVIRKQLLNTGPEHCLVCEYDGMLCGFICGICFSSWCYRAPVAQITELYVQPSARRKGIGHALVSSMVDHLRYLGANEIMLLTGEDNFPARALYGRCGFESADECCYQMIFE